MLHPWLRYAGLLCDTPSAATRQDKVNNTVTDPSTAAYLSSRETRRTLPTR
jgi:hypothetical protein